MYCAEEEVARLHVCYRGTRRRGRRQAAMAEDDAGVVSLDGTGPRLARNGAAALCISRSASHGRASLDGAAALCISVSQQGISGWQR